MYVWKGASPVYVQTSAIDLTSGKLVPGPSTFQRFIHSRGRPDWSADGKFLAYQSCGPLGGGPCTLWIRSMETGEQRELKPKLGYFGLARWSPDGQELLTAGRDLRGRNNGLYRIDVHTGVATLVAGLSRPDSRPEWAPDGKHLHYRRGASVIERDLVSGVEREIARIPTVGVEDIAVSPDGGSVAYAVGPPAATRGLYVMPLTGSGAPRALLQMTATERLARAFAWTADGRALAVDKQVDETGNSQLWIVDVGNGQARRLDVASDNRTGASEFRLDRTGRQVAFVAFAGQPGQEIRALENFLPPSAPSARAAKK
jgi:Tol biopolymer transport system component